MPIGPMYFNPLSFQQAAPYLTGFQAGTGLASQNLSNQSQQLQTALMSAQLPYAGQMAQQDLAQKQLANQLSQNTLNYAPQMSQADLENRKALSGLYGAEAQKAAQDALLTQQQVRYAPLTAAASADPLTKMILGRMFVGNMGNNPGGSSPSMPGLTSNNGGMTVQPAMQAPANTASQFQATGIPYAPQQQQPQQQSNYPVLPGGLSAAQGQQALPQLNTPPMGAGMPSMGGANTNDLYNLLMKNTLAQMGKDPTMGTTRAGAGGTYFNPVTGQTTSTDTPNNTTLDQRTVAGLQRVTPLINTLSSTLPQFQTFSGQANLRAQQGLNYAFGQNNSLPNQYAQGQAALKIAPESLLRTFGLPVTNESLERMETAVEPIRGETPEGYRQRLQNTLLELQTNSGQAQNRLKSGMNVDAPQSAPVNQVMNSPAATKTLNGRTYQKINGTWYAQ
jgi:hypothetical protein